MSSPAIGALIAFAAVAFIVIDAGATAYGISRWRFICFLNGCFGTLVLRGPRAMLAEMDAYAEERKRP